MCRAIAFGFAAFFVYKIIMVALDMLQMEGGL